MCAQCMAGAATIVAGTSGVRLYLVSRVWAWLTPSRLRHVTRALLVTAVLASGLLVSGSAPTTSPQDRPAMPAGAGPTTSSDARSTPDDEARR
jgi:hypothetical protein